MRTVTTDNQDYLRAWVCNELQGEMPTDLQCIGQLIDGELQAVASFSHFAVIS